MFRTFAKYLTNGAKDLVQFHAADLTAVLELSWDRRANRQSELGHPFQRSALSISARRGLAAALSGPAPAPPGGQPNLNEIIDVINAALPDLWDHLIYAYMIENTRIYDIFRRVAHEFLHGEKLGVPGSAQSLRWLRTTEELFYRDPPPFFITAITGYMRPDIMPRAGTPTSACSAWS